MPITTTTDPDQWLQKGLLREAAQAIGRRAREGAAAWEIYLWMARLNERQGRGKEAERLLRAALRSNIGSVSLWLELGRFLGQAGRLSEQLAWLRRAARRNSRDAEAHLALARAWEARGRPVEVERSCRAAVAAAPDSAEAWARYGAACLRLGRPEKSQAALRRAVRLDPRQSQARIDLAGMLARKGRAREALGHLDEARRTAQAGSAGMMAIGRLYQELGDLKSAERIFIQAAGDWTSALLGLEVGRFLGQARRVPEQLAWLRRGARRHPKDVEVHLALARAWDACGRPVEAARSCRAAVSAAPGSAEAWALHGTVCLRLGRSEKARAAFEEAVRLDPRQSQARIDLARLLARQDRAPEALRHLDAARQAAALGPSDLIVLGRLYHRLGDLASAERLFAQAAGWARAHAASLGRLDRGCLWRARAAGAAAPAGRELWEFLKGCGSHGECCDRGSGGCPVPEDLSVLLRRLSARLRGYAAMSRRFSSTVARLPRRRQDCFSRLTPLLRLP